jgi:hypothetical protein
MLVVRIAGRERVGRLSSRLVTGGGSGTGIGILMLANPYLLCGGIHQKNTANLLFFGAFREVSVRNEAFID